MPHDRGMQELTRAIKANTRASEALHSLLLDIERTRRSERVSDKKDPQTIAKEALSVFGDGGRRCHHCLDINCVPGDALNRWIETGCICCRLNHDLIKKD